MTEASRISLAARAFTLAAVGSICVVRDIGFQGLGLVLVIALIAESLHLSTKLPDHVIPLIEAGLTSAAVVAAHPTNEATFPYLAIPALVAGLHGGFRWAGIAVLIEGVLLSALGWAWIGFISQLMLASVVTWLIAGLGLGYLGTVVRRGIVTSTADASYREALDLIKQLQALSGKLESGLDPVSIAERLMVRVSDELVVRQSVIMLHDAEGDFSALRYSSGAQPGTFGDVQDLLHACSRSREPVLRARYLALPLTNDSHLAAILLAECDTEPDFRQVRRLTDDLTQDTVRLYAALLFTEVREAATAEERQRLAREVHDGVAQDVASLGYLVDNLAEGARHPEEVHRFATLRDEVTRVVRELRTSVFDLRNEVAAGQGLGQSIATFARHVGSHSSLTVHVTLDEAPVRLSPQVEAELLRIAQEAINNARRHSGGENLWVTVKVRPPAAEIEVLDDGTGLKHGREDSHGLHIMCERADRIDALLEVESPALGDRGTRLSVRLAREAAVDGRR